MKNITFILSIICLIAIASCGKDKSPQEDPHNHSLLNKTLDQIKTEIAGKWQIKRTQYRFCGIAGCPTKDSIYNNNTGDIISFLTNDTVRQMDYTLVYTKLYDKAEIKKVASGYGQYNGFPWNVDSVYVYGFPNFIFSSFSMVEIKNDTLVTYGPAPFTTSYLFRKP